MHCKTDRAGRKPRPKKQKNDSGYGEKGDILTTAKLQKDLVNGEKTGLLPAEAYGLYKLLMMVGAKSTCVSWDRDRFKY